jgi:hypothetical protein
MNRRHFCGLIALTRSALHSATPPVESHSTTEPYADGYPRDDYTPFGYLDNPWHTWDLHRSGILRSTPGIGLSLYFPAGLGGYFDFGKNNIYESQLALQFEINGQSFHTPEDFTSAGLSAPYHSKNLLSYEFKVDGVEVVCTFVQVNEDALAALVEILHSTDKPSDVRVLACHKVQLGAETWWGRDGLCGGFDSAADSLWIRSFAAGPVFVVTSNMTSSAHILTTRASEMWTGLNRQSQPDSPTAYYPEPLNGAVLYKADIRAGQRESLMIVMARAENLAQAIEHARASLATVGQEIARKHGEDAKFWDSAPRLTGDWPAHWKRGWVYDYETLRMMIRRPVGVYKHPWDAMQIQAPRNVLAETSIDMWALSYADPDSAKQVFLGQFEDALSDNVPCMREDGTMNMVAADGSECGTSISWCYPYFCAESIFDRTRDTMWLRRLYPHLAALLRWTLANRTDRGGFLVGKCSWETGMDASKRFLIEQPTGGELTEFIRLVELQAAAADAGRVLDRFAGIVGDTRSSGEWQSVIDKYAARTQELWKDGWFRDFDTRSSQFVTGVPPDPAQSAPAFCGVATAEKLKEMRSTLRKIYQDSRKLGRNPVHGWDDGLAWSSLMLPYLESIWATEDRALAAEVVSMIAERIYTSMDRRSVELDSDAQSRPKLGWPGVSCEIWGAHGAFGGEGYGWGAVMPAHITRSLIGLRETQDQRDIWVCPNLPADFLKAGKQYGLRRFRCGTAADRFDINYSVIDSRKIAVTVTFPNGTEIASVSADNQAVKQVNRENNQCQFEAFNNARYLLRLQRKL